MKSHLTGLRPHVNGWKQVPASLRVFIVRGALILIAWKCLYLFWLKPLHQPDAALTYCTAKLTTWLFGVFSPHMLPLLRAGNYLAITALVNGQRITIINIADACNALELMVLHIGFIVSSTVPAVKKITFISAGLVLILLTNIARCLALAYVYIAFPHFFPFAHHYIFTLVVYLIIFLVWKKFVTEWTGYEATKMV